MIFKIYCIALMSLGAISSSARAAVVFNQLVPPNSYNVNYESAAFNISGASVVSNGVPIGFQSVASQFTLQADAVVTGFDLALTYFPDSSTHDVMIKLEGNNATMGTPDGSILTSGIVTTNVAFGSSNSALTSFIPSGGSISLHAGTTYWLVVEPIDPNADLGWNTFSKASTFTVSAFANSTDGVNYAPRYSYDWTAFQVVSGTPTPEPTSTGLLALGGAGMLSFQRRRQGGSA